MRQVLCACVDGLHAPGTLRVPCHPDGEFTRRRVQSIESLHGQIASDLDQVVAALGRFSHETFDVCRCAPAGDQRARGVEGRPEEVRLTAAITFIQHRAVVTSHDAQAQHGGDTRVEKHRPIAERDPRVHVHVDEARDQVATRSVDHGCTRGHRNRFDGPNRHDALTLDDHGLPRGRRRVLHRCHRDVDERDDRGGVPRLRCEGFLGQSVLHSKTHEHEEGDQRRTEAGVWLQWHRIVRTGNDYRTADACCRSFRS
jgi:hypothetical protein